MDHIEDFYDGEEEFFPSGMATYGLDEDRVKIQFDQDIADALNSPKRNLRMMLTEKWS